MAIAVTCGSCGVKLRFKAAHAGKTTTCRSCGTSLLVEGDQIPDHDVFLSYSSKDKNVADAVCATLEARRLRCWIAPRDILPGKAWAGAILDAIDDVPVMVLIYSENSNKSPQVLREIDRAITQNVVVVPFRIDRSEMTKEMKYYIAASHWLDALDGPMEQHIATLTDTVRRLMTPDAPHPASFRKNRASESKSPLQTHLTVASICLSMVAIVAIVWMAVRMGSASNKQPPNPPVPIVAPFQFPASQPLPAPLLPASAATTQPGVQSTATADSAFPNKQSVTPGTRPSDGSLPSRIGESYTNSIGMKFAFIPGGSFIMGSPPGERARVKDETPHRVKLTKNFAMATTTVTQAQWKTVMGNNPSSFQGDDLPVENVDWQQATDFCGKLALREGRSYRLPTEAEWEYACRAGTTTVYYTGDAVEDLDKAGWYFANSGSTTHPVGLKQPNAWGLYDMHGNVLQWCNDWYDRYPDGNATDPQGPADGKSHVLRGGTWNGFQRSCRSASRNSSMGDRSGIHGFRPVLDFASP